MRVNVYAEEMTDKVEVISKEIEGQVFTGVRFWLELPVTEQQVDENGKHRGYTQHQGPFMHHPGDNDSSAVTFWGKKDLRIVLKEALEKLSVHYAASKGIPAWLQRLRYEYDELIEKYHKLNHFIASTKFKELDSLNQRLLNDQYTAMSRYVHVLYERLQEKGEAK